MDPLLIARVYFDAWNRRDAAAVLATFTRDGTYSDPAGGRGLRGDALAGYMNGLWAAFPDLSFEIASVGATGPDSVAAEWIMRGTNLGSMMGLPPTGKSIQTMGADFIRTRDGKIQSVEGYFDTKSVPEQLGLKVNVGPEALGPFQFGMSTRVSSGKTMPPGAFSITALKKRSPADQQNVTDASRQIAQEMLGAPGFISLVTASIGDRMLTITAWESPDHPAQLMLAGTHPDAVRRFFQSSGDETDMGGGGVTSVWMPLRINTMWVRCGSCNKMQDRGKSTGVCSCGSPLDEPWPYW
ncbi:MAG TPA: ester cyclase [Vicinamibacterales bacterium]|nr:ester cyclase [Vicinamibacterales bacterium]